LITFTWDWIFRLGQIEIIYESQKYILVAGYVKTTPGLYIRLWLEDENNFVAGTWIDQIREHSPMRLLPTDLLNTCIGHAERLEKLKVFA
jgi:hypothetical protein